MLRPNRKRTSERPMLLPEQNVLVTGGARGLGAAITEALAREGAGVIINYRRSEAQARALVERLGPRVVAVQADITDEASVARLFDEARAKSGRPVHAVV